MIWPHLTAALGKSWRRAFWAYSVVKSRSAYGFESIALRNLFLIAAVNLSLLLSHRFSSLDSRNSGRRNAQPA